MKQTILLAALFSVGLTANAQEDTIPKSFLEDFSDSAFKNFKYGSTGNKTNFKWKSGVNSLTESGTKVLSFKIDPEDSAGAGRGPEIISNDFTHFGTYSARLKVPHVSDIQPNAGAVVGYFTYHVDSIPGLSEIDFEWLVADPASARACNLNKPNQPRCGISTQMRLPRKLQMILPHHNHHLRCLS